jgi:multidrug efflux pump subunit AcrA (membrane-fusion protein)
MRIACEVGHVMRHYNCSQRAAKIGLCLVVLLGSIRLAAGQSPPELNLSPGYGLPLTPPPTPAIVPAAQYLASQLRTGMTLEAYLQRLRFEFQNADADADGEVSETDAAIHAQFEVASYRSRILLEIMNNDLDADGVVTEDEIRRTEEYRQRAAVLPPGNSAAQMIESHVRWLMAADTDHDGQITFDEAHAFAAARASSIKPNSWPVQQFLALAPPGKTVVTFGDVQAAAEAVFHAREEEQANKGTEVARQRAEAQRQADEARAQREAAAAQQRAEARRKAEELRAQKEAEERAACAMPKASDAAKVVIVSSYGPEALSSVTIGSQDVAVRTGTIVVEPGKEPIYLVVLSFDPVIWRFRGAVGRIEKLVLTRSQADRIGELPQDKPLVGAMNIAADRITFLPPGKCLSNFIEVPSGDAAVATAAVNRETGKDAATVVAQYSFSDVAVPSGQMNALRGPDARKVIVIQQSAGSLAVQGSSRNIVIQAGAVSPITNLKRFSPGGVVTIDPARVVAPLPVEKYEVLPEEAGLVQLVREGKIVQNRSGEYLIKKKIRFPADLYGAHLVKFLLLRGVPQPDGDPGHSDVISEQTGKKLSFSK